MSTQQQKAEAFGGRTHGEVPVVLRSVEVGSRQGLSRSRRTPASRRRRAVDHAGVAAAAVHDGAVTGSKTSPRGRRTGSQRVDVIALP